MKNKIIILAIVTLFLSSCLDNNKEINKNLQQEKIEIKETNNNNSGTNIITNSGTIKELKTNSGKINNIETIKEKETLKEIIKDKEIIETGATNKNDTETDKTIDDLLKDFDEELNIEELLGEG